MTARQIIIAVLLIICLIVLFQNAQTVTARFLFFEWEMSQVILLLFFGLGGFILGFLYCKILARRKRKSQSKGSGETV